MHKVHLLDFTASRNYLLSKAQHMVGGFGKYPGDPPGKKSPPCPFILPLIFFLKKKVAPKNLRLTKREKNFINSITKDILHSYLGLAALAAMRESELRTIDPMLCFSVSARDGLLNS